VTPQELPKLSDITARLKVPEDRFEAMVKKATGFTVPPGPQSLLHNVQEAFEKGKVPELPAVEEFKPPKIETLLGKLPELPKLEEVLPGSEKKKAGYELTTTEEKERPSGYVLSR